MGLLLNYAIGYHHYPLCSMTCHKNLNVWRILRLVNFSRAISNEVQQSHRKSVQQFFFFYFFLFCSTSHRFGFISRSKAKNFCSFRRSNFHIFKYLNVENYLKILAFSKFNCAECKQVKCSIFSLKPVKKH